MTVLRDARKEFHMTQGDLARKIYHRDGSQISLQSVSNWENLTRKPDPYEMAQAAKIFGCPVDELFKEYFY